jgi:hypothetical protein
LNVQHYEDLAGKGFFAGLITYMTSGPVVAMAWEGKNAAAVGRLLLGATRPNESAPGTIRYVPYEAIGVLLHPFCCVFLPLLIENFHYPGIRVQIRLCPGRWP